MKKVAIIQSNYIPWLGYFDLIGYVDEFIFYDSMQYTKRDWRNRNLIKTPLGKQWLSVPVKSKGKYLQSINETKIDGDKWQSDHWNALKANYSRAPYYEEICLLMKPFYSISYTNLSVLNKSIIEKICNYLEIKTKISDSSSFKLNGNKSEKLLNICIQCDAKKYVSGPSAQKYLDLEIFSAKNIGVEWFNYNNYKEYPQLWGDFEFQTSILDLLFNCGPESKNYLYNARQYNAR